MVTPLFRERAWTLGFGRTEKPGHERGINPSLMGAYETLDGLGKRAQRLAGIMFEKDNLGI